MRLAPAPYEKVWGSPHTQPWYRNPENQNIGEVWFSTSDKKRLLVKFLFTKDKLSVQVHPPGKAEMWHILRAEPGAQIALGPLEELTPQLMREAALSGEIVEMLRWIPVEAGETYFAPAGTIHAIGGGLVLCEVQQPLDVTYRLYDYDRGRELHLEEGIAVASLKPYYSRQPKQPAGEGRKVLVDCPWFLTERLTLSGSLTIAPRPRAAIYIALQGEGELAGLPFQVGDAIDIPAGNEAVCASGRATLLVAAEP